MATFQINYTVPDVNLEEFRAAMVRMLSPGGAPLNNAALLAKIKEDGNRQLNHLWDTGHRRLASEAARPSGAVT